MITCLVVAAIIHCTNAGPKPAPADAVRVITAAPMLSKFIPAAPKRELWRDYRASTPASTYSTSGNMPVPAPIKPLSEPWSVTTRDIPGIGTFTWFNGRLQQ